MYPENKILPADGKSWLSKSIDQKLLEFTPHVFCSFYQDFDVLQIQGEESKEYFFGNYFNGKYCGFIYLGSKFTQLQAAKICEKYMPKNWSEIYDYHLNFSEIWYHKYSSEQYAWIYNRVLSKI